MLIRGFRILCSSVLCQCVLYVYVEISNAGSTLFKVTNIIFDTSNLDFRYSISQQLRNLKTDETTSKWLFGYKPGERTLLGRLLQIFLKPTLLLQSRKSSKKLLSDKKIRFLNSIGK